jgi:hypothetical protein
VRCIFCKQDTSRSRSTEHIIPESLGNEEHVLPAGVVCDPCNNYFARKIELPVLESDMMRLIRADMRIPNKRGLVPMVSETAGRLPDYRLMSRFLGKIGLEVMASRVLAVPDWNDQVVENASLDPLRRYVRFNEGNETWHFAHRTLYPVNTVFSEDGISYEVLHEYQIIMTAGLEFYIVVALFGVEFVLNLGGPEIDGYERWVAERANASPLYPQIT